MSSLVFWLTGLSGAGKSTLSERVRELLEKSGLTVKIIDGDQVRDGYVKRKGFEFEDVRENNLHIAELAGESLDQSDVILVPVIAPYKLARLEVKSLLGDSLRLVYCKVPLEKVIERDVKGLYGKALRGEINNMIGVSPLHPYEEPTDADFIIESDQSLESCVHALKSYILSELL